VPTCYVCGLSVGVNTQTSKARAPQRSPAGTSAWLAVRCASLSTARKRDGGLARFVHRISTAFPGYDGQLSLSEHLGTVRRATNTDLRPLQKPSCTDSFGMWRRRCMGLDLQDRPASQEPRPDQGRTRTCMEAAQRLMHVGRAGITYHHASMCNSPLSLADKAGPWCARARALRRSVPYARCQPIRGFLAA
jgi:hypothetical protein